MLWEIRTDLIDGGKIGFLVVSACATIRPNMPCFMYNVVILSCSVQRSMQGSALCALLLIQHFDHILRNLI